MNEKVIKDIFITIAFKAINSGKEIRLEKGKSTLSLLVYEGEGHEDLSEEDEEETEDGGNFFSDRLEVEREFYKWADKNGVAKVPNAFVSFLFIHGLLNTEKMVKCCREWRQKKKTEEG